MINKMDINLKASSIRRQLGEDEISPIDIFTFAMEIDRLTLVFYPLGENISGACYNNQESSLIVINSTMSLGRQRFSLAHELYHLYFDKKMSTSICASAIGSGNETEKAADQFASYFLMPPTGLYEFLKKIDKMANRILHVDDVIRIEQYYGLSHKAMLYRLQDEGIKIIGEDIEHGVIQRALALGYDISLYKAAPKGKEKSTLGHYISLSDKLLASNKISTGKYEEYLLDAFRDDIVFGDDTKGSDIID